MRRELPPLCYRKGRKGHVYYYPHGARGKGYRIHAEPGTPAFHAELAKAAMGTLPTPLRTVKKLVNHYVDSDKWTGLKPTTRRNYKLHFDYFVDVMPNIDPARLRTVDVVRMRDAGKDTPTFANQRVDVLRILLAYGREIGWVKDNVAIGVRGLKNNKPPREPWPPHMIEAFRKEADGLALLTFEMALGTGQRIRDVLRMTWSDVTPEGIRIRQGKTGKFLIVPPTARLAAILDQTPKIGLTIIAQTQGRFRGKAASYNLVHRDIMAIRKKIGAEKWDIHGLRYSAASEIAELGFSDEFIKSITGHASSRVLQLYAGAAAQKARAKIVQKERK
jgi:integrase